MRDFIYVENQFLSLIILLIVFFNAKVDIKKVGFDQKLFLYLLMSTILIVVLDIFMISINGRGGSVLRQIYIILGTIYFILNPLPFMLWSLYVEIYTHGSMRRLKEVLRFLIIPVIINGILSILSIFKGFVFYIDDNNFYNRGDLFILVSLLYCSYAIYSYIQILSNIKYVKKKEYRSLLLFPVIPFMGGILQILFPGVNFLWLCVSISILMIFINIQNDKIYTDHLTGLYNRRQLDKYLKNRIKNIDETKLLSMIMIDINCFKEINDTYGHVEGDRALEYLGNILKESFRRDDFISRYAGDEFVAIIEVSKYSQLVSAVEGLKFNITKFNNSKTLPYDIEVSIGYDAFNKELGMNTKEFFNHIDELMYKNKCEIKRSENNQVLS